MAPLCKAVEHPACQALGSREPLIEGPWACGRGGATMMRHVAQHQCPSFFDQNWYVRRLTGEVLSLSRGRRWDAEQRIDAVGNFVRQSWFPQQLCRAERVRHELEVAHALPERGEEENRCRPAGASELLDP